MYEAKRYRLKKSYVVWILILILFFLWLAYVIRFNSEAKALDEVPVENYGVGEYASFDHNYSFGVYKDGYSIRVNSYEILETEDYLERYNMSPDDFLTSWERVCLVNITVRYDESSIDYTNEEVENEGVMLTDFRLSGVDYYAGQNSEFFALENPQMDGAEGIILEDGQEVNMTLPFDLIERYFTKDNWNHMDQLEMKIFLTAWPIQKNLILQ